MGDHRRAHTTIPARPRSVPRKPRPVFLDDDERHERGALLPWPRRARDGTPLGVDLGAKGKQQSRIAGDVRAIVLARWVGRAAEEIDADDLVSTVFCKILRCNVLPSAFDPRKASLSKYVYRITSGVIASMLAVGWRRHEVLRWGGERGEDAEPVGADDGDPTAGDAIEAFNDGDAARAFDELYPLEAAPVPLWKMALRERGALRPEDDEQLPAPAGIAPRGAAVGVSRRSPALSPEDAALEAELLEYIAAESAAGRPVLVGELAAMLGEKIDAVRCILRRLERSGALEGARGAHRGSPVAYWTRGAAPAGTDRPGVGQSTAPTEGSSVSRASAGTDRVSTGQSTDTPCEGACSAEPPPDSAREPAGAVVHVPPPPAEEGTSMLEASEPAPAEGVVMIAFPRRSLLTPPLEARVWLRPWAGGRIRPAFLPEVLKQFAPAAEELAAHGGAEPGR